MGSVLLVVGWFNLAGLAGAQTDFGVEIHQGLVTLKARDTPLGGVLGEVSRQSGLILELDGPCDEPITIELADLPVAAALQRILKGRGYVYRRGRTARRLGCVRDSLPPRLHGLCGGPAS